MFGLCVKNRALPRPPAQSNTVRTSDLSLEIVSILRFRRLRNQWQKRPDQVYGVNLSVSDLHTADESLLRLFLSLFSFFPPSFLLSSLLSSFFLLLEELNKPLYIHTHQFLFPLSLPQNISSIHRQYPHQINRHHPHLTFLLPSPQPGPKPKPKPQSITHRSRYTVNQ